MYPDICFQCQKSDLSFFFQDAASNLVVSPFVGSDGNFTRPGFSFTISECYVYLNVFQQDEESKWASESLSMGSESSESSSKERHIATMKTVGKELIDINNTIIVTTEDSKGQLDMCEYSCG